MRNKKHEVTDFNTMVKVIDSSTTVRLGFNTEDLPYILPMNFGYEIRDNTIIIYVHSASKGRKVDLISESSKITVEFDNFIKYYRKNHSFTTSYNCIMAEGEIEKVDDYTEKTKALNLLLKHCNFNEKIETDSKCVKYVNIYKITLSKLSCKIHK